MNGLTLKFFLPISVSVHLFFFFIIYLLFPNFNNLKIPSINNIDIELLTLPSLEISPKEKTISKEVNKIKSSEVYQFVRNDNYKISFAEKEDLYEIEKEDSISKDLEPKSQILMKEAKKDSLKNITQNKVHFPDDEEAINKNEIIKENTLSPPFPKEDLKKTIDINSNSQNEEKVFKEPTPQVAMEPPLNLKKDLIQIESPKFVETKKQIDIPTLIASKNNETEIKKQSIENLTMESKIQTIDNSSSLNARKYLKEDKNLKIKNNNIQSTISEDVSKIVKYPSSSEKISVFTQPRYAINPKPIYPSEARKRGYEGEVLLRVEVLSNGQVGEIEVKRSSGYKLLDQSAIYAVKQWRFIPATKDGEAIDLWVNIPIKFQLK